MNLFLRVFVSLFLINFPSFTMETDVKDKYEVEPAGEDYKFFNDEKTPPLPSEIKEHILSFTAPKEIIRYALANRKAYDSPTFWENALRSQFKRIDLDNVNRSSAAQLRQLFQKAMITKLYLASGDKPELYCYIFGHDGTLKETATIDLGNKRVIRDPLVGPDGNLYLFVGKYESVGSSRKNFTYIINYSLLVLDPSKNEVITDLHISERLKEVVPKDSESMKFFDAVFGPNGHLYFVVSNQKPLSNRSYVVEIDISQLKDKDLPPLKLISLNFFQNFFKFYRSEDNKVYSLTSYKGANISSVAEINFYEKRFHNTYNTEPEDNLSRSTMTANPGSEEFKIFYEHDGKLYIHKLLRSNDILSIDLEKKEIKKESDLEENLYKHISQDHDKKKKINDTVYVVSKDETGVIPLSPKDLTPVKFGDDNTSSVIKLKNNSEKIKNIQLRMESSPDNLLYVFAGDQVHTLDPKKRPQDAVIQQTKLPSGFPPFMAFYTPPEIKAINAAAVRKGEASNFSKAVAGNQNRTADLLYNEPISNLDLAEARGLLKRQAAAIIYRLHLNNDFKQEGWFKENPSPDVNKDKEALIMCATFAKQLADFVQEDAELNEFEDPDDALLLSLKNITDTTFVNFPMPGYFRMEDDDFSIGQRAVLFQMVLSHISKKNTDLEVKVKQDLKGHSVALKGDFEDVWHKASMSARILLKMHDDSEVGG